MPRAMTTEEIVRADEERVKQAMQLAAEQLGLAPDDDDHRCEHDRYATARAVLAQQILLRPH